MASTPLEAGTAVDEPACWSWAVPELETFEQYAARCVAEDPDPDARPLASTFRFIGPEVVRFLYFHDGRCAICAVPVGLVKDHCHRTGQVRGWLCRSCNVMEGKNGSPIFEAYRRRHPAAILRYYQPYHDGLWWIHGWPVVEYRASAWTRGPRPPTPWE